MPARLSFKLDNQNLVVTTPHQVTVTKDGDREVEFAANASNGRSIRVSFTSAAGRDRFVRPGGAPAPTTLTLQPSDVRVLRVRQRISGPAQRDVRLAANPLFRGNGDNPEIVIEC